MNALMGSEYYCSDTDTDGCESGWTLYLQEEKEKEKDATSADDDDDFSFSSSSTAEEKEKEQDLSMLSDASSAPHSSASNKRQKVNNENYNYKHHLQQPHPHSCTLTLPSFLDDTASSPLFDFSTNNVSVTNQQTSSRVTAESKVDYSQGFSATYFEERSSLQQHFDFLQPSLTSLSQNE